MSDYVIADQKKQIAELKAENETLRWEHNSILSTQYNNNQLRKVIKDLREWLEKDIDYDGHPYDLVLNKLKELCDAK